MNASSANSILKFLEEPSDDIVAILLTTNLSLVMPTIISRCQVLNLNNIKNQKDIYEIIKERYDSIYSDDNYEAYFNNLLEFVHSIDSMKNRFFIKYKEYTDIFSSKDDIKIVIDFMLYFYYDILNLKFERDLVYFNNYIDELNKVENNNSKESINYKLEVIERTKLKLSTNANIKMVLDKMIIEFGKED
jgi:DNA polymerase-3 subunit delta'